MKTGVPPCLISSQHGKISAQKASSSLVICGYPLIAPVWPIKLLYAPVEEWIGGWNVYKKQYTEVEYVMVKMKYFIMSYNSEFFLVNVQASVVYFTNAPSQHFWEEKLGKPKEDIRNLNGFEYMYLSNLKVPYFCVLIFRIHKSYFHGHDTLPLHGKTCSAIDEQTETGPKKTPPTTHLNVRWRKKDQGLKVKTSIQLMLRVAFTGACGMVNDTAEHCIYSCAQ